MRLKDEAQILDGKVRKVILDEIRGNENVSRKAEYLKRYEVYKDQTKKHVVKALQAEGLREETVAQMANRAGNISLCRKIVNKKARAYSGGVQRTVDKDENQKQLSELARLLAFDQRMKKGDRYRELHRNGMLQIVPELDTDESTEGAEKYRLKFSVLAPWQYDVVEDYYDRERPLVVIISDYSEQGVGAGAAVTEAQAGVHGGSSPSQSSGKDEAIADNPRDAGLGTKKEFIWWSSGYHFTTDEAGSVIGEKTPDGMVNPIDMLPFVNNAEEQDGQFWAVGGDDLVDGTILINKKITDMNYIAYLQGYGQLVVTGANLGNERFRLGPQHAIVIEYDAEKGEPAPSVDFISANPPLESWMRMIEQYVALLLTTNNLSPSNVSGQLTANSFPSGIAMLIEQSESTDDITDKQRDYVEKERQLWTIARAWFNEYFESLCEEFKAIGKLPDVLDVTVKFMEAKPATTEAERLDNIKRRKDLGINEEIDLILLDNPDMTHEEAEEKLKRILGERLQRATVFGTPEAPNGTPPEGDGVPPGAKKPDDKPEDKGDAA